MYGISKLLTTIRITLSVESRNEMNRWRNWIIAVTVVFFVSMVLSHPLDRPKKPPSASLVAAEVQQAERSESPIIGYSAPNFSLTGLDGKIYELRQQPPMPVILNFWASWCGPCHEEAAFFVKLHKLYGDRAQILAINLTAEDSLKSARKFTQTYGFTFPVLLDTKGQVADLYRIRAIPSTLFIDEQGIIKDGVLGAISWDDLRARTLNLLENRSSKLDPQT
jgi:cytochrome c biogenesis protein CcmG/thiol:disulfide interchange protein DsbE